MKDPGPLARDHFGKSRVGLVSYYIFHWRAPLLAIGVLLTLLFAWSATRLDVQAGFTKMLPLQHPYMKTFLDYQGDFGGANKVLVSVQARRGTIFTPEGLAKLKAVHEDLFFTPGVDRSSVLSLYSPNTIFMEVVEDGFRAGPVLPSNFVASPQGFDDLRANLLKSQWVGRIVASDFSAALVSISLLERDPDTGARLDLKRVGAALEAIRAKHEDERFSIHIVGFAKSTSDIAAGASGVMVFFGIAFAITAGLLLWYSGSWKLATLALAVAVTPVVWLLGLLPMLGLALDPLSILVPFLIFSIGVSHAVQMTKSWEREVVSGADSLTAARRAFAKLFIPGTLALLTNVLGFAVIMLIPIDIVRELGITASLGVGWMIVTNKMLLPILLSYLHMSRHALAGEAWQESRADRFWRTAARGVEPRRAGVIVAVAAVVLALGLLQARNLKVGDYGIGVPELRPDSRYNLDNAKIVEKFAIGVNTLGVVAQTKNVQGACTDYGVMSLIDDFDWHMQIQPGTQSVISLAGLAKVVNAGFNEGNIKWRQLPRDPQVLAQSVTPIDTATGLLNPDCSAMQVLVNTRDQQGETLVRLVDAVKQFNAANASDKVDFRLATGNMGVAAATNEAVDKARWEMNFAIFGALLAMCLATFRSLRATLCILVPLALVSVLCEALMPLLGIGLKVSTLPVVALGVGVGVDYGIYLYDRIGKHLEEGKPLATAFFEALRERGTAMVFTAVTMTIGVATWALSALKFQADMGVLLAFMFFLNMLGALFLLPALASFLLRPKVKT